MIDKYLPAKYNKLYIAIAGVLVQLGVQFLGVNSPYTVTLIGLLTALGVYGVANEE